MTRQVIEYTDLVELFLVLFLLMSFVFFGFLFYFYRKYTQKIEFLDKKSLEYNENLLAGINILIEQNKHILNALNNITEENEELVSSLKSEHHTTQEYIMTSNENLSKIFENLIHEFSKFITMWKENHKLLHIINRKIHNKPKIYNVQ